MTANPYALFKTDKDTEAKVGIILDYDAFRIHVRRAGGANRAFAKALEAKMKPHRFKVQHDALDDATSERILIDTYAETVVSDWDIIETDEATGEKTIVKHKMHMPDGTVADYSTDNVKIVFAALMDLFRDVQTQAGKFSNFAAVTREVDAGN